VTTSGKETIAGIGVYIPTGEPATTMRRLAPRLSTVRGMRIGVLDNCKEFADLVLRGVALALERDHGAGAVRFWRKSYLGIGSPFAAQMAAECDAVINGVGH
jgi:hypothetical protein